MCATLDNTVAGDRRHGHGKAPCWAFHLTVSRRRPRELCVVCALPAHSDPPLCARVLKRERVHPGQVHSPGSSPRHLTCVGLLLLGASAQHGSALRPSLVLLFARATPGLGTKRCAHARTQGRPPSVGVSAPVRTGGSGRERLLSQGRPRGSSPAAQLGPGQEAVQGRSTGLEHAEANNCSHVSSGLC